MAQNGKPPAISALPVILVPTVVTPGYLQNTRSRAMGNATFQLNTSATIDPEESLIMPLHVELGANSAIISVEQAEGAVEGAILVRLWQDGTYPTVSEGLPLKDGGVIEILGSENIRNTRIISADDRAHTLQVQYFS